MLFTGAQKPFALGMRAWLRERRPELDRESTVVISVGALGEGPLTYSRREGPLLGRRVHRQLTRICSQIVEDGGHEAHPSVVHESGDAGAAVARGLPAITVSSPGTKLDPASLDRAFEFCRELAERVDAEVGPQLEARSPEGSAA